MSSILVVGADHLGNISEKLGVMGFQEVVHVSGRKGNMVKTCIPDNVSVVLVLTDYVNHNLAKVIRQKAKSRQVPVCYAKRSWSCVRKAIELCPGCTGACPAADGKSLELQEI